MPLEISGRADKMLLACQHMPRYAKKRKEIRDYDKNIIYLPRQFPNIKR